MSGRHPTFNLEDSDKFREAVNADTNPVMYLAIDPGKFNGVCGYDTKGYLQFMYVVAANDISLFLRIFQNIKTCVIESFLLFPNKAQKQIYSDMETSRVIGRVEDWAKIEEIKLVKQPPTIKVTGYKWVGKKPPPKSSNQNDPMDAHVHFIYWAVRNGVISAASLLGDRRPAPEKL